MSILPVGISGETTYSISRSLRFNSADSAYLNRTLTTPTNSRIWTWSGWVKRSSVAIDNFLFSATAASPSTKNDWGYFYFDSTGYLKVGDYVDFVLTTPAIFRDPSSFYHVILSVDTTQATATNRIKLYVNGVQYTYTQNGSFPTQNEIMAFNKAMEHRIGRNSNNASGYANMYLTEVNFIDGQALTPSSFGETDPITGVWKPKKYTGTYGTNGFYLNFSDNSGTTATTLGKDYSGNGNNWTPNNFSVTAGAGNDSLVDVPTLWGSDTGAGGEVRGNYCTLNPLNSAGATLSNGNLDCVTAVSGGDGGRGTMAVTSGKWYWEFTPTNNGNQSLSGIALTTTAAGSYYVAYYANTGNKFIIGSGSSAYGATYTNNDVIGVALDLDSGTKTVTFYKNNVSQGAITITPSDPVLPIVDDGSGSVGTTFTCNFGQRPFAYTAPSGFKALCTTNLPEPTIKQGDDYFNAVLYTGTGAIQSVTGLDFQPDFVWLKCRSAAEWHSLFDSVRGALNDLRSNTTDAEVSATGTLTSFNSNGFSLGTDPSGYGVNTSTRTYVAWNWKANGTGVTNTAGTITSTVSANTTSGFSIVNWTGSTSTSAQTVGHGLGVAPSMVILKNRDAVDNWWVYHASVTSTSQNLYLNTTAALTTQGAALWGAGMTSTLVGVRPATFCSATSDDVIMYCFAPVAGYSAFGSYTGNGSTDGPFVFTGFRPRFLLIKRTDSATSGDWRLVDSTRESYNGIYRILYPNLADAESSGTASFEDLLSNGFKLRTDNVGFNANGSTYIYAAFAEFPFRTALAR